MKLYGKVLRVYVKLKNNITRKLAGDGHIIFFVKPLRNRTVQCAICCNPPAVEKFLSGRLTSAINS